MVDSFASSYDGDIIAVEKLDGLARYYLEVVVSIDIGYSSTPHTDIARLVVVDKQFHQFFGKAPVRGQAYRHSREGTQYGNVVQRVVGST